MATQPPVNDLTGKRYGKLLVLAYAGKTAERHPKSLWSCHCDCGRVEVYLQKRLTGTSRAVSACTACRQPLCQVCGTRIPLDYRSKTVCSDNCKAIRKRHRWREEYKARFERDPDMNSRMWQRRKEAAATDPDAARRLADYNARSTQKKARWRESDSDYAEKLRVQSRASYARHRERRLEARRIRRRSDPAYAQHIRDLNKESFARHADKIRSARKAKLAAMTPEQLQQEIETHRTRQRIWRRRWRAELKNDPERLRQQRAKEREWESSRALRRLFMNLEKMKNGKHRE